MNRQAHFLLRAAAVAVLVAEAVYPRGAPSRPTASPAPVVVPEAAAVPVAAASTPAGFVAVR